MAAKRKAMKSSRPRLFQKLSTKYGYPPEEFGFRVGDILHCVRDPKTGELGDDALDLPMPFHRAVDNPSLRKEAQKHLRGAELKRFNAFCEFWDADGQFGRPASRNYK